MYPEVNLGTFIPGHLSDDIVVQYRYWYDIATSSSQPFNVGQLTLLTAHNDVGLTDRVVLNLYVHLKTRGQR